MRSQALFRVLAKVGESEYILMRGKKGAGWVECQGRLTAEGYNVSEFF